MDELFDKMLYRALKAKATDIHPVSYTHLVYLPEISP